MVAAYCSALTSKNVDDAFRWLYSNILASIPAPSDPSQLIRRGIQVGRKLAQNPQYRQQLFTDFKHTTDVVDWL